ncbi:putative GTP pyrophosphokinase [Pseudobutyrivibrio xylanivorans]|uniref:Putative GTP pyrophosphokinase n=2 Tax=Pseudobutyrivibrio xylanivorans TaxID=185007 RepID=A0A1G5RUI2_PSEXY|nr:putative GTP pyrophosphokinase [Pseudobutyrivibrio xylanivorans]
MVFVTLNLYHISMEKEMIMDETISVTEIVSIGNSYENNMARIAAMEDEFSHTIDPILRMYNAAMNLTEARLNIIKDEFEFSGKRVPIHHIDTRLKSSKSILGKLEKKGMRLSLTEAVNNIYDIAGIRCVCPYIKDVYLIRDRILAQDDIHIIEIKDYIASPKPNGYRSLHMIIRVPVYFMGKKQMVPVEIQLRTMAMDLWASLEHDIKYKSLSGNLDSLDAMEIDFEDELLQAAELIYSAQQKLEMMNSIMEK